MFKPIATLTTHIMSRRTPIPLVFLCILTLFYLKRSNDASAPKVTVQSADDESSNDTFRPAFLHQPKPQTPSVKYIVLESNDNFALATYDPYPNHNGLNQSFAIRGALRPCIGPRGEDVNGNADDMLLARFVGSSCMLGFLCRQTLTLTAST